MSSFAIKLDFRGRYVVAVVVHFHQAETKMEPIFFVTQAGAEKGDLLLDDMRLWTSAMISTKIR